MLREENIGYNTSLSKSQAKPIIIISTSSCYATSMDIPDPLSPLLPIVHRFWQVHRATSCILTELLYVGSSWSPCFFLTIEEHHF